MCVLILFTNFVRNISHSKKRYDKKMCIGRHATAHYFCQMLMKLEFSRQIIEKHSNIKFHENPSNGSRVFPYEKMDARTDRQI